MSDSKPSTSAKPLIVRVAVLSPLRRTFDYLVTDELAPAPPQRGCRVRVPFGKREVIGLVIEQTHKSDFAIEKLKPVAAVIDTEPLLPETLFKLFIWAANYYHHPIGDALFNALPVRLRLGQPLPLPKVSKWWRVTDIGRERGQEMLRGGRLHKQRALLNDLLNP